MLDNSWPGWGLAQSAISAASGLLGVLIGTLMTSRSQAEQRKKDRFRDQFQNFYSPMLGIWAEIDAKRQVSERLTSITKKVLVDSQSADEKVHQGRRYTPVAISSLRNLHEYDWKQWTEQIFPLYEQMHTHFRTHMYLAEKSTRNHYNELVNFIELRKRNNESSFEPEVILELDFSDAPLGALSKDLHSHFERLATLLVE